MRAPSPCGSCSHTDSWPDLDPRRACMAGPMPGVTHYERRWERGGESALGTAAVVGFVALGLAAVIAIATLAAWLEP